MKKINIFFNYLLIFIGLMLLYESDTVIHILYDYLFFDFRYLLFILVQFYWVSIIFQIVYQYISLYPLMRIRLSQKKCIKIIIKQYIQYCLYYISIHVFLELLLLKTISIELIGYNIIIQSISFLIVLGFKNRWTYSYVLLIFMNIMIHMFMHIV